MPTIKRGDIYPIEFTVNTDLTGATVRLLARKRYTTATVVLPAVVSDEVGGKITHMLSGALEVGDWLVEVEVARGGDVFTFPTRQDAGPQQVVVSVVGDIG